jgi:cyclopropane-fatty-acyl-phospholipid synthase
MPAMPEMQNHEVARETVGRRATRIRWASGEAAILASEPARRHAAFAAFVRIVYGSPRPLFGALTVLFDGHAFHFGEATAQSASVLSAIHRGAAPSDPDRGSLLRADRPRTVSADTPESLGFDLAAEDLGLNVDRRRRFALPVDRDTRPGEWVHPVIKVRSPDFFVRLLVERNLGLGESFIERGFEMLRGSPHHFIAFLQTNDIDRLVELPLRVKARLLGGYLAWRMHHSHNEDIADHYDIGDNIMVPMLGATGCYSCGYMENESDDLDRLQQNKMNLIFSKMRLEPGMRILDTGCGNGGMLVHAALTWGCEGVGFTNSYNMASLARRNAERNGVADKVTIHHADFSLLRSFPDGHFDAIYEVGVWEHLRFRDYPEIMSQCARLLNRRGRMLIHSMASVERVHRRDGYIQKYIFRDSNQIRLHLLLNEAARLDMYPGDVENLGRHYYWTLWHWRKNLIDAYERDHSITEKNFRVMLHFLECGMSESRFGDGALFHILLFKDPREYLQTWRVDARVHEPGRGGVLDAPLEMRPSSANEHLHNDQHTEAKKEASVYRRPDWFSRIRDFVDIVRSVTHQ